MAKKAYRIYQERKYHTRLLFGALRNHYHWSEFIGGDLVLTIAYGWQKKINSSRIAVENRIDNPVRQEYVDTLYERFEDFRKAYDDYGATRKTLKSFLDGYAELAALIRGYMLVN